MNAEPSTLRARARGTLPAAAAVSLEQSGSVVLPGPFSGERFDEVSDAYDAAVASAASTDVRMGTTSTRVQDFVHRGPAFDPLYVYPPLLDAALRVVDRDFKLSSFGARTLHAGPAVLDIHVDVERDSSAWPLLGFILMIDPFRPDNGATRFVSGSHRWAASPSQARLQDHAAQLVSRCGPAGSVLVFNGSTWHGQGINDSGEPRRSLQGAFIPRAWRGAIDFSQRMTPQTRERLGGVAHAVLALPDVSHRLSPDGVQSRWRDEGGGAADPAGERWLRRRAGADSPAHGAVRGNSSA